MNGLSINKQLPDHLLIAGDLTFATIDKNSVKSFASLVTSSNTIIDLAKVNTTDSAGLALIIEWLKIARKKKINLQFDNIPGQLLAIAKLSGFDQVISTSRVNTNRS